MSVVPTLRWTVVLLSLGGARAFSTANRGGCHQEKGRCRRWTAASDFSRRHCALSLRIGCRERPDIPAAVDHSRPSGGSLPRRQLVRSICSLPILLAGNPAGAAEQMADSPADKLVWAPLTAMSQEGGGVVPQKTYPLRFVTYLARFLLNYDQGSQEWWKARCAEIPLTMDKGGVQRLLLEQFAQFSESVEVGLRQYQGKQGARSLFSLLNSRYASTSNDEGRRQLAILFSFMDSPEQPTELISRAIARADNATVSEVVVTQGGSGYTGTPPKVTIASPQVGSEKATATAVTRPTGGLLRIDVLDPGSGFSDDRPPDVTISEPLLGGEPAVALAVVNNGTVSEIKLVKPGSGYSADQVLAVTLTMPADEYGTPIGSEVMAVAVRDYEIEEIRLRSGGQGYANNPLPPLLVNIQPPGDCGGDPNGVPARARATLRTQAPSLFEGAGRDISTASFTSELLALLPSSLIPSRFPGPNGLYTGRYFLDVDLTTVKPSRPQLDPIFGPKGVSPVEKERELSTDVYLRFALSGAACTAMTRSILVPLDVVKTRQQIAPTKYTGLVQGASLLYKEEGLLALFKALDVSAVTGALLGGFGFGLNEFFRRYFVELAGTSLSRAYMVPLTLTANTCAVLITCLVVCPFEGLRIRLVSQPSYANGLLDGVGRTYAEGGLPSFWSGLVPLMLREVPFTICKFVVFDVISRLIFALVPAASEGISSSLVVALVAGLVAGIAGAIVSTPADTILTKINAASLQPQSADDGSEADPSGTLATTAREPPSLAATVGQLLENPSELLAGVGSRCIFFGVLIAGQFFLYDFWKVLFQVSTNDLKFFLDVFADRMSFYQ